MFKSNSSKSEAGKLQLNVNLTFIGLGCKIDGSIDCAGNLRVEGEITGNVTAKGDVEIAPDGRVTGKTLTANNVVVHGHIKSNISARGLLRIHKHAVVEGDVSASALDIENGARFVGYSNTGILEAEILQMDQAALPGSGNKTLAAK